MSIFSCNEEEKIEGPSAPSELISQQDIIPIIIDLQILESHYHRTFSRPDTYKDALDSASSFVFENHGVSKQNFEESYQYYAFDINKIYSIYEATLDSINIQITEAGQIQQVD